MVSLCFRLTLIRLSATVLVTLCLGTASRAEEKHYHPQLGISSDGSLFLISTVVSSKMKADIVFSYFTEEGKFSDPKVVNEVPGSVMAGPDEFRPASISGADNRIAIGWTDIKGDVYASISSHPKSKFDPPIKLNQDENEKAIQSLVTTVLDSMGVLHAVWLDARRAGPFQEEPADLYYGRVEGNRVFEENLTASDPGSVCGCCRPAIEMHPGDGIEAAYRSVSDSGHRDIYHLVRHSDGKIEGPTRYGSPLWKIEGCPLSGPTLADGIALWNDSSSSRRRLLAAMKDEEEPETLLEADESWHITMSPRSVSSFPASQTLVLVPGDPQSKLLVRKSGKWQVLVADLPSWCSSGAVIDSTLYIAGIADGSLRFESRSL